MATWTTAVADLRTKLSDGPTDKLMAFKRVFGKIDGTNTLFKTFEFRRLTNFTTATSPLGLYVDGALTPAAAADDISTGYFTVASAPSDGSVLEATYYIQWFLDAELDVFLKTSAQWILGADDPANIPEGLRPSALSYSAAEAYQKLALRWVQRQSETYRMEDAPDPKNRDIAKQYQDAADALRKTALEQRNDYYSRKGQALAPTFGMVRGNVKDVPPNR
jgi:hypothetical protein